MDAFRSTPYLTWLLLLLLFFLCLSLSLTESKSQTRARWTSPSRVFSCRVFYSVKFIVPVACRFAVAASDLGLFLSAVQCSDPMAATDADGLRASNYGSLPIRLRTSFLVRGMTAPPPAPASLPVLRLVFIPTGVGMPMPSPLQQMVIGVGGRSCVFLSHLGA